MATDCSMHLVENGRARNAACLGRDGPKARAVYGTAATRLACIRDTHGTWHMARLA